MTPEILPFDLTSASDAAELLALQRRAYRVEAALIGSEKIPPLRETLAQLQSCGETFLVARVDGALAAAISWRYADDVLDVHRLFVDPCHFRRGLASALLRSATQAEPAARRVIVQTGAANAPAVRFYEREGFVRAGEVEPLPGLRVARFTKQLG
jgi:ribosomal protein S18 acetylase RimI-like enzyme